MKLINKNVTVSELYPQLQGTIRKIINDDQIPKDEWRNLFEAVHMIFTWDGNCDEIFYLLKQDICHFVTSQKRLMENQTGAALLDDYNTQFQKVQKMITQLQLPFHSVSASGGRLHVYLKATGKELLTPERKNDPYEKKDIIREIIVDAWEKIILGNLHPQLTAALQGVIDAERSEGPTHSETVIATRQAFLNFAPELTEPLNMYIAHFEKPYLKNLRDTYSSQNILYLETNGLVEYMKYAEKKLKEEDTRGSMYLNNSTESKTELKKCLSDLFITRHLDTVYEQLQGLVEQGDTEILSTVYSFLEYAWHDDSSDGDDSSTAENEPVNHMINPLKEYIIKQALSEIGAKVEDIAEKAENYVHFMLDLVKRYGDFVNSIAGTDPRFTTMRDMAFQTIINDHCHFATELPEGRSKGRKSRPESRCPEHLASYYDLLLKRSSLSKRLTPEEIKKKLEELTYLLRYITSKDVFIDLYKKNLTRRLIMNSSHDFELETYTLEQFNEKLSFGDDVNSMKHMLRDITTSKELSKKFNASINEDQSNVSRGLLDVKVLTHGAWKCVRDEKLPMTLPVELERMVPQMEEFYKGEHANKELYWQHHMSDGVLTFKTNSGIFDLELTTVQMSVLLSWNLRPQEKIPLEGLHLATDLPENELRRTLYSLVKCPKIQIQVLGCDQTNLTSPKDFTKQTEFWLNHDFYIMRGDTRLDRGSISLMPKTYIGEKTQEESSKDIAFLRESRTNEAIISVMKEHRILSYAELQMKTINKLVKHFAPTQQLMKDSIEELIKMKLIKQDSEDANKYVLIL